ncbi:MAG: hypothetical protein ACRD1J_02985 [Terriglobia bacterium]
MRAACLALSAPVNANNQVASFSYDQDGDVLAGSMSTYAWSAEGRMTTVSSTLYGSERYTYDGDGRRVKKQTAAKLYWYGTDGNILAEWSIFERLPTVSDFLTVGSSYGDKSPRSIAIRLTVL